MQCAPGGCPVAKRLPALAGLSYPEADKEKTDVQEDSRAKIPIFHLHDVPN